MKFRLIFGSFATWVLFLQTRFQTSIVKPRFSLLSFTPFFPRLFIAAYLLITLEATRSHYLSLKDPKACKFQALAL